MHWAAIVFGWPAALTALALSASGLALRRPALVWAGAIVGLPFMLYLMGAPRFWFLPAIAAPCHFAAAAVLGRAGRPRGHAPLTEGSPFDPSTSLASLAVPRARRAPLLRAELVAWLLFLPTPLLTAYVAVVVALYAP